MNFYDIFMNPLEKKALYHLRKKYIVPIKGKVLEIGAGTGINLDHYGDVLLTVTDMTLSNTLMTKIKKVKQVHQTLTCDVSKLPFKDHSFDYVVSTLVFCSVVDVNQGLKELHRVLKPSGKLIFIEHVHPKEQPSRAIFNALTPLWKRMASGCHLNRDYIQSLEHEYFKLENLDYAFGTKFVAGVAIKTIGEENIYNNN